MRRNILMLIPRRDSVNYEFFKSDYINSVPHAGVLHARKPAKGAGIPPPSILNL